MINSAPPAAITPSGEAILTMCQERARLANSHLKFSEWGSADKNLNDACSSLREHLNATPAINPLFSDMNGSEGCVAHILKMFHHRPDQYVSFITQALWFPEDPTGVDLETTYGLLELSNILSGMNDDGEYILLTDPTGQPILSRNKNDGHPLTRPTEVRNVLDPLIKDWEREALHKALSEVVEHVVSPDAKPLKM